MTNEKLLQLRDKSSKLPKLPGIYIMKDKNGKVIYVGKSRSLKDRVSQYFHLSSNTNVKTFRMVSQIDDFETIFCDTEIEALALENTKIKQYTPKYNILLKDSKSYPYIKVTMNEQYPRLLHTRKRLADGAKYFGPYSGMSVVHGVLGTLERALSIPMCKRQFPRDIGKERPCIYKQLGRCVAPCDNSISAEDYYKIMQCAVNILRGNIKSALSDLNDQMLEHAQNERFEDAARCRDAIQSMQRLKDGQKIVGAPEDEFDVIGIYSDDLCTAISVFYVRNGMLSDSETFVFGANELVRDDEYEYMTSFFVDLYLRREYIPSQIILSFEYNEEEKSLAEKFLKSLSNHSVEIRIPQKGENKRLCEMVELNAKQQAKQFKEKAERDTKVLAKLSQMLGLDEIPERIEAYDISNFGNEHITAGMIVSENGKLNKSDYRFFKIKYQQGADDYSAMREVLSRRIAHLQDNSGSYSKVPDLILLDGGMTHVKVIKNLFEELKVNIPVFGMVKDEHHKTRTIVTDCDEISIAKEQSVFTYIYKLQEEVHRFTVSKMDSSKRRTLKISSLERIKGIGKEKAKKLLLHFKTISSLKEASIEEICKVNGISLSNAKEIYNFFRN